MTLGICPSLIMRNLIPGDDVSMQTDEIKSRIGSGLLSFPVTHFDQDLRFSRKNYQDHVARLSQYDAAGLFVAGGTGEFFSLTPSEIIEVLSAAREVVLDTPIICGCGYGTHLAVSIACEAEQAGADGLLDVVREALDVQAFHVALENIWSEIRAANSYVDRQAPWTLKKEDPDRMQTVLYVLADVIRQLALITQPFVPEAAGRMLDQVAVAEDARDFNSFGEVGRLTPGAELPKPEGIFPRFVEEDSAK